MEHQSAKVNNTYLHILMPQLLDPLGVTLKRHSINLLHHNLIFGQDACQCRNRDLIDIMENVMVANNVSLDFSKPYCIIG